MQKVALAATEWIHFRFTDQSDGGSTSNDLEIRISAGVGLTNLLVLVGKNEYATVDDYFITEMGVGAAAFELEQMPGRRKVTKEGERGGESSGSRNRNDNNSRNKKGRGLGESNRSPE